MCGISGALSTNLKRDKIKIMSDIINHRGPDEEGIFFHNNVGIAHKRLKIIDLENGKQPMTDRTGRYTLVYNGEIYNYLELKNELEKKGIHFTTKSDTEVLLESYKYWGESCLPRFNGMYAFVIYDNISSTLFGARDEFGIKPLYFKHDEKNFIFCSEIKGIISYLGYRPDVDVRALSDYFTLQYILEEKTLFKGISRLLPGHCFTFSLNEGLKMRKYWQVTPKISNFSPDIYFETYKELLIDSVKIRTRCDVPLGAHLSGGIDSASIVSILSEVEPTRKISTFTAGFSQGGIYDDSKFANLTSNKFNTDHQSVILEPKDIIDTFNLMAWHLDEPMAGEGVIPQYFVSKLAREKVTVTLGGQGADEHLGGYVRYYLAYLDYALRAQVMGNYTNLKIEELSENLPQLRNYLGLFNKLYKKNPMKSLSESYFEIIKIEDTLSNILSEDLYSELSKINYSTKDTFCSIFSKYQEMNTIDQLLLYDLENFLPSLLHVEDRVSMAVSLESRLPFLDKRLIEYSFSIPEKIKFYNGKCKHLLKKIMTNKLPNEIIQRKDKIGFPVPLNTWAKGPLADFCKQQLTPIPNGLISEKALYAAQNTDTQFGRQLWGILSIQAWHNTNFTKK